MFKHNRLLSVLAFTLLLIGAIRVVSVAGAFPTATADTPGPLPNACQEVTVEGEDPPLCCAFGYVYYGGVPVSGAQVTIEGPSGTFSTTTSTGPAATDAYYRVSLSASPLGVSSGDTITVAATYSGYSASTIYQVVSDGQQVDVVIPMAGGSQPPIGTINYIYPNPAQQGSDTVAFAGSGVDGDEDGATIVTWEWTSDLDGVLSTEEDFLLTASSLSSGTHTISFRVQDDEGEWSAIVSRTLGVQPGPDRRWVQVGASGPVARHGPAMVYDSARAVIVLFGGWAESGHLNDTWEFNGSVWTQVSPSTSPPGRSLHAMVYDSARGRIVLFGGQDDWGSLDDTWEYDGANWVEVSPAARPAGRWSHAMAYDSDRGKVVLFGGWDGVGPRDDTWEYDGTNWTETIPTMAPSARYNHAMTYNAGRQRVMLFGGYDSNYLGDSWEYDGSDWIQLSPSAVPPARHGHRLVYNSDWGRVALFGGRQSETDFLDDTWEYDGSTWTQILLTTKPQPRAHYGFAYDGGRGQVVLFGGWDGWAGTPRFDDTWEYGPGDFKVIQVSPPNASNNIAPSATISATFNQTVDFSTVTTRTFTVRGQQTGIYTGTYSFGSVQFDATADFKAGEEIVVNLSSGLKAADGAPLTPFAWGLRAAVGGGSGAFVDSGQSLGSSNSRAVALGDVDGDGDLDAFVVNEYGHANKVWLNDGGMQGGTPGTFSDSGQSPGSSIGHGVAMGDLDGDGDLDVFVSNADANEVWLNDGTGIFSDSGQRVGGASSEGVALGDVDGDGDLDAFVTNSNQPNKVWLNDGTGTFSDSGQSLGSSISTDVALGDVDGDGDLDAFVANGYSSPNNKVWLNNGTGVFNDSGQSLGSSKSQGVALGDVDGDGDLDAFVANGWDSYINKVWLNDGAGTFSDSGQSLGYSYSMVVSLGDVDDDGDLDAFVANYWGGANKVWLNDGAGAFIDSGQSLGSLSSHAMAALGDVDGDGDLDAFVGNYAQPNKVWLNGGGGLSITDVTVVEGNTGTVNAVFTVTLSPASDQQVTVVYATADGSATAGEDYVAGSGMRTFPAGTTTQQIAVTVNGDTLCEPDETFFVNLSNPTNAGIADGQGVGAIEDDDCALPSLSIDDETVVEGDSGMVDVVFTVSLSEASGQQVTVNYTTTNGTATAGEDYVATSGTLIFPALTTSRSITVQVIGDTLDEANEIFTVALSNPTNATIGDGDGVGTITDDDDPPSGEPDITVTPASVNVTLAEGQGTTVPLRIGNVGDETLTFAIAEENTTAALLPTARSLAFPSNKVDPALLDALDAASDGGGTFFAYLEEQADLSAAYAIQDWKARGEYVYHTLREVAQRSQKDLLTDLRRQQSTGALTEYQPFFILNAVAVTGGRSAVDALAARPDVTYLALEPTFEIPEPQEEKETSATSAGVEWGISKIGADRVWADFGVTGAGVVVANIDTGVDYAHLALVNQYRGTATGSHDYNWYDPTGRYPNAPGDNNSHGTHTMGTMVGDDGAGNQIGVAPGGQWIAAKGCSSSVCYGSDLLAAAEWVLAPCPIGVAPGEPACDASRRPRVVNNSWGGGGGRTWFQAAVQAWRAAGIFPAFAAGNSGPGAGTVGSPGDYPESFASGATDSGDVIAWFSSRGPSKLTSETKPDVAAPGRYVRSSVPGGGYSTKSGTSMASPHTAGAVGLILEANPSLSVSEVESLLMSTAKDLGKSGSDYTYGYGRIDVYEAVANANDPVPWLSETPTSGSVEPSGEQIVTLTLNAAGLNVRTYTADLIITSNDPDESPLTVPVTLNVTPPQAQTSGVRISNLRDVSASVSWTTSVPADGTVYYGTDTGSLTNVAYDDRGAVTSDEVHHVTLSGLSPNTTYYFFVLSDGVADTNDGSYYSFTTGCPLGVPSSDSVYGQVFKSDGVTPASDVLIYIRVLDNDDGGSLHQSGLLSALTDASGYWYDPITGGAVNLAIARREDGCAYFNYSVSGDAVRVRAEGGDDCDSLVQLDTDNDSPAPPITLSCLATMELDISTEWNVFVLPAPPAEVNSAEGLLDEINIQGGDALEVNRWLPDYGNWGSHIHDLPFGDFDLEPGRPYFLRADKRSLVRLQPGIGIDQTEVITLTTGWNFIALPRTTEPLTAEEACTQIAEQGGAVSEIDLWHAETNNWAAHICGLPFGDFTMTPDEGYFILSQADSIWRPEGVNSMLAASDTGSAAPDSIAVAPESSDHPTVELHAVATISNVRGTNVSNKSFSVSWLTDVPASGHINYGVTPTLGNNQSEDPDAGPYTHHATVSGLSPSTAYYFDVVSNGNTDDNGGAHYTATTGPTLGIPGSDSIYGQVFQADGTTPAEGTIVYVTLVDQDGSGSAGSSAEISALVDSSGYWYDPITGGAVNLAIARTADLSAYFEYSPSTDGVILLAQGAVEGWATQTVDTSSDSPAASMTLCYLLGDLDGDGDVDVADIMLIASRWRCRSVDECFLVLYDLHPDGVIDIVDIMLVVAQWGETCP